MPTLVRFKKDWADEFDVECFGVYGASLEEMKQTIIEDVVGKSRYFGTNEGWESGEITINDFKFVEITEDEAATLRKVFGCSHFGTGSNIL